MRTILSRARQQAVPDFFPQPVRTRSWQTQLALGRVWSPAAGVDASGGAIGVPADGRTACWVPRIPHRANWAGLHASDECALPWALTASLQRPRSRGFRCPGCDGKALDLPCLFDGYRPARVHAPCTAGGCTRGVSAERLETPLVGGAARFWRRGGNPPAPAFPRRGKRERGRFKFLAAAG